QPMGRVPGSDVAIDAGQQVAPTPTNSAPVEGEGRAVPTGRHLDPVAARMSGPGLLFGIGFGFGLRLFPARLETCEVDGALRLRRIILRRGQAEIGKCISQFDLLDRFRRWRGLRQCTKVEPRTGYAATRRRRGGGLRLRR